MLDTSDEALAGRRQFRAIALYLVASSLAAFGMIMPGTPATVRLTLGVLMLAGFLVVSRVVARRLEHVDEFHRLIAWRAMAVAGLVTVWFELFLGLLFLAFGANVFTVVAVGAPQFWLATLILLRQSERYYDSDQTSAA